jgi:maltose O-acetyltransferase
MFRYLLLCLYRKIPASKAVAFFNKANLSRNKKNRILKKAGLNITGRPNIRAPFYFETGNIILADRVFININCFFMDNAPISIGQKTMIGPNVTISTAEHPVIADDRACIIAKSVTIGSNVWIGTGAVILPGVTIGDNSIIGANSVVNCDVPANCLYAGTPAIFKKSL